MNKKQRTARCQIGGAGQEGVKKTKKDKSLQTTLAKTSRKTEHYLVLGEREFYVGREDEEAIPDARKKTERVVQGHFLESLCSWEEGNRLGTLADQAGVWNER